MVSNNVFNSLDFLEPRCPKCNTVLDYGVNTRFDPKLHASVCLKCGHVLK